MCLSVCASVYVISRAETDLPILEKLSTNNLRADFYEAFQKWFPVGRYEHNIVFAHKHK